MLLLLLLLWQLLDGLSLQSRTDIIIVCAQKKQPLFE
jgi:hypothetical protein